MAARITEFLSPQTLQAGLTRCGMQGQTPSLRSAATSPPSHTPSFLEAVPTSQPPQPSSLAPLYVQLFLPPPVHPHILQEAHFCLQRVLLEASQVTLAGGMTGLALGLT